MKELKEHGPDDIVVAIAGNKNDLGDIRWLGFHFGCKYFSIACIINPNTEKVTVEDQKKTLSQVVFNGCFSGSRFVPAGCQEEEEEHKTSSESFITVSGVKSLAV